MQREREYLTRKELCQYLGAGERTINGWMKARALPHYRIGGKVLRFKCSEVDEWFSQFRVTETDPVNSIVDEVMASFEKKQKRTRS